VSKAGEKRGGGYYAAKGPRCIPREEPTIGLGKKEKKERMKKGSAFHLLHGSVRGRTTKEETIRNRR